MLRRGGKSTSVVSGVRRKVHTTFEDGREMVEEYDTVTDELCTRRVRSAKTALGREGAWVYEVGEEPKAASAETGTIAESGSNVRAPERPRPVPRRRPAGPRARSRRGRRERQSHAPDARGDARGRRAGAC